jgi:GNAT superfamily N-acetyltransferase
MEQLVIRKGTEADLPAVLELIRELALFEKAPEQVTNTLSAMKQDAFGSKPVFDFHVAELSGHVVGMAVYFVKYSTWKGKGLYLDDLMVTEQHRGKGIGSALFNAYMKEAMMMGAKQAHWQVLDWNEPAIRLYRKINASIDATWLDCKLTEEQINHYSNL